MNKCYTCYEIIAINTQGGVSWTEPPQGYSKYYARLDQWHKLEMSDTFEVYGLEQAREHLKELWARCPEYQFGIEQSEVYRYVQLLGWYQDMDPITHKPTGELIHFTEWTEGEIVPNLAGIYKQGDYYVRRLPQYDQAALDKQWEARKG